MAFTGATLRDDAVKRCRVRTVEATPQMTSPTSQEEPEQLTVVVDEPRPGVLVAQLTGWLDLATAPDAEVRLQELNAIAEWTCAERTVGSAG